MNFQDSFSSKISIILYTYIYLLINILSKLTIFSDTVRKLLAFMKYAWFMDFSQADFLVKLWNNIFFRYDMWWEYKKYY